MQRFEHGLWLASLLAVSITAGTSAHAQSLPGGTATSPGQPTAGQTRTAESPRAAPGDAAFVQGMALAGLAEVELGKMAEERGTRPEVTQYGRMLIEHHTQANAELMKIAAQLGVQIPAGLDDKNRAIADRLSALDGEAFDREFMRAMVASHEQVRTTLQNRTAGDARMTRGTGDAPAATSSSGGSRPQAGGRDSGAPPAAADTRGTAGERAGSAQLDAWARKTLPAVEQHLKQALQLQQSLGAGTGAR